MTTITGPAPALGRIDQVCVLVDDLDRAVVEFSALYAATSWRAYFYGPETVRELGFRGARSTLSFWVALSDTDPQLELIQSVSGPSIYTEWLDRHGPGFHHFGTFTQDLDAGRKQLEQQGYVLSQWGFGFGADGDGRFAYFDSVDRLGLAVELIEVPTRRRAPDRAWTIER